MKLSGILIDKGLQIFDGEMKYHAGHEITRLWIVVVDQEKAHIYRKIISDGVELIATAKAASDEKHHDIPNTSHGRMKAQPQSQARHTLDFHHERERKGELKFVRKLAEWLDAAEKENAFDRLVLIAAPKTLGELRPHLTEKVHSRIMTELDKDLAGLPDHKIREHLAKIVWF